MIFALVFLIAAVLGGGIASVAGFGIRSILTPTLAAKLGTKLAVAAVSIPHFVGTALRFTLIRRYVNEQVLVGFGIASAVGGPLSSRELYHAACGNHAEENLFDRNPPQEFEVAENLAGAQHHAAQRVVRDADRQPRFFPDSLVQVFQ
jgi:hypothetical protein